MSNSLSSNNHNIDPLRPATAASADKDDPDDPGGDIQAHLEINNSNIIAGGSIKIEAVVGNPSLDRWRNQDIDEETSRLHVGFRYLKNSRDTEFQNILHWIRNHQTSILWLHGGAGIGKSTMVHHLVDELDRLGHLATYCFFVRNSEVTKNLTTVIQHMSYLLCIQYPSTRSYLSTVNPPLPSKPLSVILETLIVTPLRLVSGDGTKIIIFDALDECCRSTHLIDAIHELCPTLPPNVKFLITSRFEQDIGASILEGEVFELELLRASDSTMTKFFTDRLNTIPHWKPSTDDIAALVDLADGLFVWAATVCSFVTSPNKGHPSDLLRTVLSLEYRILTEGRLSTLYMEALKHLFPPNEQLEVDNFRLVFGVMLVVFERLDEKVLRELVGDKVPTSSIISTLRSLHTRHPITTTDAVATPAADLFHTSFLDFIVSEHRCTDVQFRIIPQDAHKIVATRCISLMTTAFANPSAQFTILPEVVRYAVENWASHAIQYISEFHSVPSDVQEGWALFLERHGGHWGQLLLEAVTGAIPPSNDDRGPGDDWLSWLNAKFLNLYHSKLLGRHLRKILDINQVATRLRNAGRDGKTTSLENLTLLFRQLHNDADWTEVISFWLSDHPDLASSLNSLAIMFYSSFNQTGMRKHLEEAISLNRAALVLRPSDSLPLNNLAISLLSRSIQTGSKGDLLEVVSLLREVVGTSSNSNHIGALNNLADSLRYRFTWTGSQSDLAEAIEIFERLTSDSNSPLSFGNYGDCLRTRFEFGGSPDDLDKAIALHRKALHFHSILDAGYPGCLVNLARSLRKRFEVTRSQEDLDEAISLSRQALELRPVSTPKIPVIISRSHSELAEEVNEGNPAEHWLDLAMVLSDHQNSSPNDYQVSTSGHAHSSEWQFDQMQSDNFRIESLKRADFIMLTPHYSDRPLCLGSLGLCLTSCSNWTGSRDVDEAISLHREALDLIPAPHPKRHTYLGYLADSLQSHAGSRADLDEAISLHREALESTPAPHPERPPTLINLATALRSRAAQSGSRADLDEAVSLTREALESTPAPHPERPPTLINLATALRSRAAQSGSRTDLDEAVSLTREALDLRRAPHPEHHKYFGNLAKALRSRATNSGSRADLDEAVSLHQEALDLTPAPHPERLSSLNFLANALLSRHAHVGSQKDIDQAISLSREAFNVLPDSHFVHTCTLLPFYLQFRYEQTGSQGDLDEAISLHREALAFLPSGHSHRSHSLTGLANCLRFSCKQAGSQQILAEAISLHNEALDLWPTSHTLRPLSLDGLAECLQYRFEQDGPQENLDKAICLHREALEIQAASRPRRFMSLHGLAKSLRRRFELNTSQNLKDLDEAIVRYREAHELLPDSHFRCRSSLGDLANVLRCRFDLTRAREDLDEADMIARNLVAQNLNDGVLQVKRRSHKIEAGA